MFEQQQMLAVDKEALIFFIEMSEIFWKLYIVQYPTLLFRTSFVLLSVRSEYIEINCSKIKIMHLTFFSRIKAGVGYFQYIIGITEISGL